MPIFVKVSRADEVRPGEAKRIDVAGRSLALFNLNGRFHTIDDACSHRGGSLSEGQIEGDTVVCPWHGARFSVVTGAVLALPGRSALRSYPTRVNGEDVEVEL